jgi:predicted nuclease of predicted toxin-antitoxin system
MWLLDVNVPRKLTAFLRESGIAAATAESRGWNHLTNGELVEAAATARFTCILTRDRQFGESAARVLRRSPQFSVVLITIPQLRGPEFLNEFRRAWQRDPIRPLAGTLVCWPPG